MAGRSGSTRRVSSTRPTRKTFSPKAFEGSPADIPKVTLEIGKNGLDAFLHHGGGLAEERGAPLVAGLVALRRDTLRKVLG
mmetsp:Transcript_62821/g.180129  ORF Transcript_62821/g.180129 Transcript_62821/m.180129 type:complete len:81 (-) Transcript_62821:824-1066(-)